MNATQFPLILSTGAIARYPLARQRTYATKQVDFADYSRQVASLLANPLMRWDVTLSELTDQETADLSQFFDLQKGSAGTFTFIDPWDNLLQYSETFENPAWTLGSGMLIGQNYLLNSQDFALSSWSIGNCTVTANTVAAPDGTTTADTLDFTVTGGTAFIFQSPALPVVASMPSTNSVWLRVASGTATVTLYLQNQAHTAINTTTCNVTTSWQRFSVSGTMGSGDTGAFFLIGNPTATGNVFAWGAQAEYGSAVSDYTPTTTATAVLQIADPFFKQAPSGVPGFQWNLNSLYQRRGRQLVVNGTAQINQYQAIVPGGAGGSRVNGLTLTSSIYVKQQDAAPPSATLFSTDSNGYEDSTVTVSPSSSWQRFKATKQFSGSNSSNGLGLALFFGAVTGTLYIFGAQLEAEGVVSGYKQTQAVSGVHPKCYIMTDEYAHIASEFDVNIFENSMRQRRSTLSSLSDVLTICESN